MSVLSLLLAVKMVFTGLFVALPLLLWPKVKLDKMFRLESHTTTLFRLYGVAMLALLVGYASGIALAEDGMFPWGIAWMGLVSNAGAAWVLYASPSNSYARLAAGFVSLIALSLLLVMLFPAMALTKLW